MRIDKYLLGGIVVALAAVFVIAANWYRQDERAATETAVAGSTDRLVRPHSPTLGPEDAPVTLVEFLDPECEACGAMHPIVKRVLEEFDGRIRLVVRYMPLHHNSAYAAGLLEAARSQDKYWELMDVFFARQPEWASHDTPRPELLASYAAQLGLDVERLAAAAADAEVERRIRQDSNDGQALGVDRTPTFFVNGRPLARIGYEPLRSAIVAALPSRP
jgi:protein-disulfide isomerase